MKRFILWGIIIFFGAMVTQGFGFVNPGVQVYVDFPTRSHEFRVNNTIRGMFIYRTQEIQDTQFNHNDVFVGTIHVNEQSFDEVSVHPGIRLDWEFQVVKMENGVWQESNAFNIFSRPSAFGFSVEYHFRKDAQRGLYGIRATAYRSFPTAQGWQRERARMLDWYYGETDIEVVYEILYGDYIQFINPTIDGSNILRTRGNVPQFLSIQLQTNSGAMDTGYFEPAMEANGFFLGALYYHGARIDSTNIDISITRNGFAIPQGRIQVWDWAGNDTIMLNIPNGLSASQYVITLSHPSDNSVVGTFVIDNTTRRPSGAADLSAVSMVMIVLGTIMAVAAIAIFVTPKVVIAKQEKKYSELQNQRYMEGDGSKVDKEYKAQSAKSSLEGARRRAKGTGFLSSIQESRTRREIARQSGLTMEQFRELEKQHKQKEKDKEMSLSDFRAAAEEKKVEKPKVQKEYKSNDGFNMLESLDASAVTMDEQIVQGAIQPNIAGEKSILSDLREMTGDDEETKRIDASERVEYKPVSVLSRIKQLTEEDE